MNILTIIVFIYLFIISIIDLKHQEIPSVILTGMLFVISVVNINNMIYGVLSFIIAYLLYEADFIGGVADIKIMVIIGLMLSTLSNFLIYVFILLLFGTIWKITLKYILKNRQDFAFIPCLFFVYLFMVLNIIQ